MLFYLPLETFEGMSTIVLRGGQGSPDPYSQ